MRVEKVLIIMDDATFDEIIEMVNGDQFRDMKVDSIQKIGDDKDVRKDNILAGHGRPHLHLQIPQTAPMGDRYKVELISK